MNRRRFMHSAGLAAAWPFPFTLDPGTSQAAAQTTPPATASKARVLSAGQDLLGAADRTLGFSHIAFKLSGAETGGSLFILQHTGMTAGGPALHLHLAQEEWFYVEEGEILFQLGEEQRTLKAGDTALAPRKIPHTFTTLRGPARMTIAFSPAGNMEQYFLDNAHPNPKPRDPAFYGVKVLGPPLKTT